VTDSATALAPPNPVTPATIDLVPQDRARHGGRNAIFGILLSLAVIAVVIHESGGLNVRQLWAMVPVSASFWIAYLAFYFVTPVSEWFIFRELWNIPPSGIVALVRKKVYNELLLGYLGEAYFYTWARRRVHLTAAPFGAVKDVAILSAMAGNLVTLVLLVVMLPTVGMSRLGLDSRMVMISLGVLMLISLGMMVLRRSVFSLPRRELWMIMQVHLARIVITTVLYAVLWHLALPTVPLSWWLFLATLRMLVSRLPLVPNKDLLFAGIALVTLGHEQDIAQLMTLMAGLILASHLVLGAALATRDLAFPEQKA